MDFVGPFKGQMHFFVVDSLSKLPEVVPLSSTSSTATLVSDKGPQFVADEFKTFLRQNGV